MGDRLLRPEAGWPIGPPASSSETWSAIIYLTAGASHAVGSWSEASRYADHLDPEHVEQRARSAGEQIARLAAAVLHELGDHVDKQQVVAEADALVDEIDDEDNGLQHAADAIGSLLQSWLVCLEEQLPLPDAELDQAAVQILAPLLTQYTCLLAA